MNGNPEVIARLIAAYHTARTLEEQAHLQEHAFELNGWAGSECWDAIEAKVHTRCIHPLLDRIFALGGLPTPGYAFEVAYSVDDFAGAIGNTIAALQKLRDAYAAVCEAAEDDDDYVTIAMAWKSEKWVEKSILRFEGLMVRYGKLGTVAMTGVL